MIGAGAGPDAPVKTRKRRAGRRASLREPFVSGKPSAFSGQPVRGGRAAVRPPHGARLTEVKRDFRATDGRQHRGTRPPSLHQAGAGETRFAGGTSAPTSLTASGTQLPMLFRARDGE